MEEPDCSTDGSHASSSETQLGPETIASSSTSTLATEQSDSASYTNGTKGTSNRLEAMQCGKKDTLSKLERDDLHDLSPQNALCA